MTASENLPSSAFPETTLKRARIATAGLFFLDGLTFATWVTRIPAIQEKLQMRNSVLGFALLAVSVGALVSMPITGKLVARFGSRTAAAVAVGFFGAGLFLPGLATGFISLSVALTIFGAGFGAVNVAANAQAVSVEAGYDRQIMASFHAIFSFGGIAGAALGSVAAAKHVSPAVHFSIVAIAVIVLSARLHGGLLHDRQPPASTPLSLRDFVPLLGVGMVAFCSAMGEGSMSDWSAVFLRQVSHANASVAALGFGAFSLCMTGGRLTADRVTTAIGPVNMVRLGSSVAAAGLALAMLAPASVTAILGFAMVGAGLAALIPTTFSAAGRAAGMPPSVAIAAVSTMGYFGFLSGPPLIGLTADRISLRWALVLVFAACCTATYFARYLAERQTESGSELGHSSRAIPAISATTATPTITSAAIAQRR